MDMNAVGFSAEGLVTLDNTLEGNTQIIGAHLHTGSSSVNGPANIIFCGGPPLPGVLGINGECDDLFDQTVDGDTNTNMAGWKSVTSKGGWDDGANNATAIEGATSLEDGAATTYDSFMDALDDCDDDDCDVYFNIHTNYSFAMNPGVGLARGQLMPVDCPDGKPDDAKCFGVRGGAATSANTNMVTGLASPLPDGAGEVEAISGGIGGDVLITYVKSEDHVGMDHGSEDGDDSDSSNSEDEDSAAVAFGYNFSIGVTALATSTTFATWLLQ